MTTQLDEMRRFIPDAEADLRTQLSIAAGALEASAPPPAEAVAAQAHRLTVEGPPELYADWSDRRWAGWVPDFGVPPELRIGAASLSGHHGIATTLPMFTGATIVLATEDRAAAAHAHHALHSLALRMTAALGPGVVVHLIDPQAQGFGFPGLRTLPSVAPRTTDDAADLRRAHEQAHADAHSDGPLHLVLAMDFPRSFSHQAVVHLNRLANLRRGVQLVVHHDLGAPHLGQAEPEFDRPIVVELGPGGSAAGPWGIATTRLDPSPPASLTTALVEAIRGASAAPGLRSWAQLQPTDEAVARREAVAVVGQDAVGRPLELTFGADADGESRSHVVIGATTGSGKSELLHSLIMSLANRYPPDEVQFYLVDGRDGAEFQAYRELPHAKIVTLRTPRDLARGIVGDLKAELRRRNAAQVAAGVNKISELPSAATPGGLARLIVIIDEYQVLLEGDESGAIQQALAAITAQGRAAGVHLVLASQRFHAAGMTNRDAIFANIRTRVALKLNPGEIDAVVEFDAAGRQLIRDHCLRSGDVVVSHNGGGGPHLAGRVARLPVDDRSALVTDLGAAHPGERPLVLDGMAAPDPAQNPSLRGLARTTPTPEALQEWVTLGPAEDGLGAHAWHSYESPAAFVVGRTHTVFGSANAVVNRAAHHNLAVLAPDAERLVGVVFAGLCSWSLCLPPGQLRVSVLNGLPARDGDTWSGAMDVGLTRQLAGNGHEVTIEALEATLARLGALVERRSAMTPDDLADQPTEVLVVLAPDRLAPLLVRDGRYGPELAEATQQLDLLVGRGPILGIHVLLATTGRTAWTSVWPEKHLGKFLHRFYQQMPEDDSVRLLGNLAGHRVEGDDLAVGGPRRMGYQNSATGQDLTFLPYVTGTALYKAMSGFTRGVADGTR